MRSCCNASLDSFNCDSIRTTVDGNLKTIQLTTNIVHNIALCSLVAYNNVYVYTFKVCAA